MSAKRKAESHSWPSNKLRSMKPGDNRKDSERDSGFSDASSEHMSTMDTTDSEDSPRPAVQQGSQCSSSGPRTSQLAVMGGSYSSLSPMIIMNNVLLKQPGDNPPALKPWGFSPAVEVVQPVVQQPQVVFLQPVVSHRASKDASSRHRRPKKYLPILKAYPKIAPHPGDSSSSSGRGTASSSSSSSSYSSSISSGSERGGSSASSHKDRCQRDKQQRSLSGGPSNSGSGSTAPSLPAPHSSTSPLLQQRLSLSSTEASASSSPARERPAPAVTQSESPPSASLTPSNHTNSSNNQTLPVPPPRVATQESSSEHESNHADNEDDNKRKRFCNTYNVLSKSGLLGITLRTKDLLRQNRRTQNDLDRLKEHTNLFLQALQSGDSGLYDKLRASLQEEDREKEKERVAQSSLKAD